jgi:hypothetical protein
MRVAAPELGKTPFPRSLLMEQKIPGGLLGGDLMNSVSNCAGPVQADEEGGFVEDLDMGPDLRFGYAQGFHLPQIAGGEGENPHGCLIPGGVRTVCVQLMPVVCPERVPTEFETRFPSH